MKIREIILEDVSAEEQLGNSSLGSKLVPVLMFLKHRSADKELAPKLRTDSLIQMVQNAGDNTFTYSALVAAHESNPAVKELIKSFSQHEVELATDSDIDAEEETADEQSQDDMEQTVDSMAKNAAGV